MWRIMQSLMAYNCNYWALTVMARRPGISSLWSVVLITAWSREEDNEGLQPISRVNTDNCSNHCSTARAACVTISLHWDEMSPVQVLTLSLLACHKQQNSGIYFLIILLLMVSCHTGVVSRSFKNILYCWNIKLSELYDYFVVTYNNDSATLLDDYF